MPKDIKNTIRIIISFFCGMFFALFLVWIYSKLGPYDVRIKSFTENGSYVEYPQIKGLKNKFTLVSEICIVCPMSVFLILNVSMIFILKRDLSVSGLPVFVIVLM